MRSCYSFKDGAAVALARRDVSVNTKITAGSISLYYTDRKTV